MNLNYNTDATFDFDSQNLKLKYDGKEDEIIKLVEAGNVSFPSNSSLVEGRVLTLWLAHRPAVWQAEAPARCLAEEVDNQERVDKGRHTVHALRDRRCQL